MKENEAVKAWRKGPFRWLSREPEVMFGQVREDTSLEESIATGRILCIASGGDLAFACLAAGATNVVAIDVNPAQAYLVELKVAAFRKLEYREILGAMTRDARPFYDCLRTDLSEGARKYFDARPQRLARGLQNAGKIDESIRRLMRVFHLFVHRETRVRRLLEKGDMDGWSSRRWRAALGLLLSRTTLTAVFGKRFGEAAPTGYAGDFRIEMERVLRDLPPQTNPFAWQCFTGTYPPGVLPNWLTEEGAEKVRRNLARLTLKVGDIIEFLAESGPESFDRIYLSNILDGAGTEYKESLAKALAPALKPGGDAVSRSFFPGRSGLDKFCQPSLVRQDAPGHTDRSFFCRYVEVFECRRSTASSGTRLRSKPTYTGRSS